ncbi:hypothetical protein B0T18DRAFT_423061 [Schizothecium vesticola]|uniref:Ubiquitin-like domain-containing protein n=1 Tax=Schizothecium vesticola TaxID=314040 RepID=A0AA40BR84_9PEZI|nr:hypothetical protein B0T18DRAFT_423061 [Schizothecium vesticola]
MFSNGREAVYASYGNRVFRVYGQTVQNIKLYILEKQGIPVWKQKLSYRGDTIENPEQLASDFKGKFLKLVADAETDVKALAIAPGGSINQRIDRGTNNPRIWDVGNSKILSIQLIDSRTFEVLTGMEPPETLITPDIYKELGLSFYQTPASGQQSGEGVVGQWETLKGPKAVAAANAKNLKLKIWKGKGKVTG